MLEPLSSIISAPVANILILSGIIFLIISVVGKVMGKIEPGKNGRLVSGIIGGVLLMVGLFMHSQQATPPPVQPEAQDTISQVVPRDSDTQPDVPPDAPPPQSNNDLSDLSVSHFKLTPSEPIQGQSVSVLIRVSNLGQKAAGPFTVQWWSHENAPQPAKQWGITGLAARQKKVLQFRYKGYPSWYSRLTTKVVIDPQNNIKESDINNNTNEMTISVQKSTTPSRPDLPDLLVSQFKLTPRVPIKGQPVLVRISISNLGQKAAGPFTVQWWSHENAPQPAKQWGITGLAARQKKVLQFRYKGYPSWYGRLTTKVVVDPRNEVKESKTNNNTRQQVIRVKRI